MQKQKIVGGFTPLESNTFLERDAKYKQVKKNPKNFLTGFTLIELLIVIAIIGILASIVLVSLQGARKDALDAAIISEASAMMKAAQLEAVRAGGVYTGYGVDITSVSTCSTSFGSAPDSAGMRNACVSIVNKQTSKKLWVSTWGGTDTLVIMAHLPGSEKTYCIGSRGASSNTSNQDGSGCGGAVGTWLCPGCAGGN
jgi:type IV pilus assembly protein PilA